MSEFKSEKWWESADKDSFFQIIRWLVREWEVKVFVNIFKVGNVTVCLCVETECSVEKWSNVDERRDRSGSKFLQGWGPVYFFGGEGSKEKQFIY